MRVVSWIALVAVALATAPAAAAPVQVSSVGPTDASFEWTTEAAEPTKWWVRPTGGGDAGEAPWTAGESPGAPSRHHVAEVEGLRPGSTYEFRTTEDGPATVVRTPEPPPGELRAMLYVLTDVHLCVEDCPNGVRRLAASREAYAAAMADIVRRDAALVADIPRAILILGDLAQRPTAATWDAVAEPDRGGLPLCVIPGNHDGWDEHEETRLRELRERLDSPQCAYEGGHGVLDLGPWRIVLLDSSNGGANEGALGDQQRAWLEAKLAEAPGTPTLLATHHPWASHPAAFALGRDARFTYLQDGNALEAILEHHSQVTAVLSGHVHVNWTGKRGAVTQLLFSALVQYPMGRHSLALYDGGFVRRYHPLAETAAEAAASAEEIRQWGRSTGIPFADGVTAVVCGGLSDRSAVVALPPGTDAPGDAAAAVAGPPLPPAGAAEDEERDVAAATSATLGAEAAVARAESAGGTETRPRAVPSRGSGCRCAAAGAEGSSGGVWLGAALVALLRRRRRGATGLP